MFILASRRYFDGAGEGDREGFNVFLMTLRHGSRERLPTTDKRRFVNKSSENALRADILARQGGKLSVSRERERVER
jgi:hypothetical protein